MQNLVCKRANLAVGQKLVRNHDGLHAGCMSGPDTVKTVLDDDTFRRRYTHFLRRQKINIRRRLGMSKITAGDDFFNIGRGIGLLQIPLCRFDCARSGNAAAIAVCLQPLKRLEQIRLHRNFLFEEGIRVLFLLRPDFIGTAELRVSEKQLTDFLRISSDHLAVNVVGYTGIVPSRVVQALRVEERTVHVKKNCVVLFFHLLLHML